MRNNSDRSGMEVFISLQDGLFCDDCPLVLLSINALTHHGFGGRIFELLPKSSQYPNCPEAY